MHGESANKKKAACRMSGGSFYANLVTPLRMQAQSKTTYQTTITYVSYALAVQKIKPRVLLAADFVVAGAAVVVA